MTTPPELPIQFVLLRGLARESRHWGEFPQLLQNAYAADGRQVQVDALDLPGTGKYSEMKSPVSIGEIAEFARDKLNEIRKRRREAGEPLARNAYLVAVSLGGMVASRWLERWPDDYAGCVLINTSFKGVSPAYHRLRPLSLIHIFNSLREQDMVERERHILRMISNKPETYERVAAEWAQIQLTRPVTVENFARQLVAAARFSSHLERAPVPTLILNSSRDRMVHPSCSKSIATRWGAELVCHPTAGHDLPLDEPDWVVREILRWQKARAGRG